MSGGIATTSNLLLVNESLEFRHGYYMAEAIAGNEIWNLKAERDHLKAALEKLSQPIPEPTFKWKLAQAAYWRREAMKRWVAAAETLTQDAHS